MRKRKTALTYNMFIDFNKKNTVRTKYDRIYLKMVNR